MSDYTIIANDAAENIYNQLADNLNQELNIDFKKVRNEAKNFINVLKEQEENLSNLSYLLKEQSKVRRGVNHDKSIYQTEEYIKRRELIANILIGDAPKKIFQAAFTFQEKLNNYFNTKIAMVIILENEQGQPEIYQMTTADILKYDYNRANQLVGRYLKVKNNDKELQQSLKKIEIDNLNFKFSLQGLKNTRSDIIKRYNYAHQKGLSHYVLWKPGKYWKKIKISSKGDIEEAYANFIFLNQKDPNFNKALEQNIDDYIMNGINQVDNISGLLKGDSQINDMQIGIKSIGASTLGWKQIQEIAELLEREDFNAESLAKIKEQLNNKKQKTRSHISKYLETEIEKAVATGIQQGKYK